MATALYSSLTIFEEASSGALLQFGVDRPRRDDRATNVVGMGFRAQAFGQSSDSGLSRAINSASGREYLDAEN
jgi:hypothetical protein